MDEGTEEYEAMERMEREVKSKHISGKARITKFFDDLDSAKIISTKLYRKECNACSTSYELKIAKTVKAIEQDFILMVGACNRNSCQFHNGICNRPSSACDAWINLEKKYNIE